MAEGLSDLLGNLSEGAGSQQDPNTPLIATNTQAVAAGVEGLHQSQKEMLTSFSEMSGTMQSQYAVLSSMLENLIPIREFLVDSDSTEITEKAEESSGKKEPDVSDVQKLPDRYAMPALLIHTDFIKVTDALSDLKGVTDEILGSINGAVSKSNENADALKDSIGEMIGSFKESSMKSQEDSAELRGSINEMIGSFRGSADKAQEDSAALKGSLEQMIGSFQGSDSKTQEDLSAIKGSIDELIGVERDKATLAAAKEPEKDEKSKDKNAEAGSSNGIKNMFGDLMKGVADIGKLALGLMAFAAAAAIFAAVAWGPALVGLAMFGMFIAGSILLVKIVAKDVDPEKLKAFGDFAIGLSLGLILFGVALVILSLVVLMLGPATLGVLAISLFFIMFGALGALAALIARGGMNDFAEGVQKLSFALLLFAGVMMLMPLIASLAISGIFYSIPIMLTFLAFSLIGAAISRFVKDKPGFKDFAEGCQKLSLALLLFAGTMVILFLLANYGFLGIVPPMMSQEFWKGPALIMVAFLAFVAIGALVSKFSGDLKKFAIGAILITVALVLFSLGLLVLNWVYNTMIRGGGPMVMFGEYQVPFSVLLIMGLFVAFIAIGVIASKVMGNMIAFAVASILMSVGLVVFAIAINMLIDVGQRIIENPEAFAIPLITYIALLATFTIIGAILTGGAIIGIIAFAAASILMGAGLIVFATAMNLLLDVGERLVAAPQALAGAIAGIMAIFISMALLLPFAIAATISGVFFIAATVLITPGLMMWGWAFELMARDPPDEEKIKAFINQVKFTMNQFGLGMAVTAAKSIVGAAAALASSVLIAGVFFAASKTFDIAIDVYNKTKEYDVDELMKPSIDLIHKISTIGQELKGVSMESALAFAVILDSTLGAMERIVEMIDALADPRMVEMIPPAQESFKQILHGFFGVDPNAGGWTGDPLTLLGLMKTLEIAGVELSEGQLRAAEAMVPLTAALGTITDIIVKLQGVDVVAGTEAIRQMFPLLEELNSFASIFKGKKSETGGVFGKIGAWAFGEGDSASQFQTAADSMKAMHPMIDEIQALIDKVSPMQGAAPEGVLAIQESMELISQISEFADMFRSEKQAFWSTKVDSQKQLEVATASVKKMIPLLEEIGNLVDVSVAVGVEGSFPDFGASVRVNIIEPLLELERTNSVIQVFSQSMKENVVKPMMELEGTVKRVELFEKSMQRLSSTLKDFVKSNKSVLGGTETILDKAANFAVAVKDAALSKLGLSPKKDGTEGATQKSPIESIAQNVSAMAKKMAAPGADEWGGAMK
jgi:hypothetical protein